MPQSIDRIERILTIQSQLFVQKQCGDMACEVTTHSEIAWMLLLTLMLLLKVVVAVVEVAVMDLVLLKQF